ncbi:MAG: 2-amino-4-hydroxy-6-hydroxymethyldihydropteridine diphosphokinase [Coriobacteriia bacterium]|nr:2-amino-4-hydroxy-6-hydroxymethyldihydropteridine diphosphokinase [Coriobacteriia bacterium]
MATAAHYDTPAHNDTPAPGTPSPGDTTRPGGAPAPDGAPAPGAPAPSDAPAHAHVTPYENTTGDPHAVIALGANIGNAAKAFGDALRAIASLPQVKAIDRLSRIYKSAPAHVTDQPDFANAVAIVRLQPATTPLELLHELQKIEVANGRASDHEHWGPRPLDLDIIDFAGTCSESDELKLPHPFSLLRDFVVTPLLEIAPGYVLANGCAVTRQAVQFGNVTGLYQPSFAQEDRAPLQSAEASTDAWPGEPADG